MAPLDLDPEDELFILFEPVAAEAWGWGHSEAAARAFARMRMAQVDQAYAPRADEEPVEAYLRRCRTLRVTVPQSDALDLLRLLDLQCIAVTL